MKKELFILILCLFCLRVNAIHAQTIAKPLTIGDTIPDITISNVENNRGQAIRLSDYRGKLVILDFWDVWCSACITYMPEMQRLQTSFDGKLQVIMVTKATRVAVDKQKRSSVNLQNNKLLSVMADSMLSKLFPYRSVPTHVWISADGVVLNITSGATTTEQNIAAVLGGRALKLHAKKEVADFDQFKPLWLEGGGRQIKHLKYYSYIAERIPDLNQSYSGQREIDSATHKIIGYQCYNNFLPTLYQVAFGGLIDNPFQFAPRTIIRTRDSVRFRLPNYHDPGFNEWHANNDFCYKIHVPAEKADRMLEFMQQDLKNYFGYSARVEKRETDCLVLIQTDSLKRFATRGGKKAIDCPDNACSAMQVTNFPVSEFVRSLQYANSQIINIIDGTGYKGNVDIAIDASIRDLAGVDHELAKYGLKLAKQRKAIDMLVISD